MSRYISCSQVSTTQLLCSTLQEFCRIYKQFFPFGDPTKLASLIFSTFEVNRDGLVEFRHFISTLSVTSRGSVEEKLQCKTIPLYNFNIILSHYLGCFKLYDRDNDGYITKEEMIAVIDAVHKMVVSDK